MTDQQGKGGDDPRRRRRGRKDGKEDKSSSSPNNKKSHNKSDNNHHSSNERQQQQQRVNDKNEKGWTSTNHNKKRDENNSNSNNLYPSHQSLLIQLTDEAPTWFEYGKNLQGRNATITTDPPVPPFQVNTPELVARYRSMADQILRNELDVFDKQLNSDKKHGGSSSSSSDQQWIQNTMKHGTLKDRIAAMSVLVSTNPVHKFYSLDGLLHMAGCSPSSSAASSTDKSSSNANNTNSRVAQMAAEALEELFLNTLLPPDRKLLSLEQRPLYKYQANATIATTVEGGDGNQNDPSTNDTSTTNSNSKKRKSTKTSSSSTTTLQTLSPRILLLWRLEELVNDKYSSFLTYYLERTLRREGLELSRMAALRTASNLLRSIPQGEAQLLSMLVNKLGDPSTKVAAVAAHELRRVVEQHQNMQAIVAREVQQLAHRPHLSPRALYNCITFLNQLRLYKEDDDDDDDDDDVKEDKKKKKKAEEKNANKDKTSKKKTLAPILPTMKSLPASLIKTYFQLFEVAVNRTSAASAGSSKQKEDNANSNNNAAAMKGRLLSALLTGVNRAHPYLPEKDQELEEHVDALYRIVHTAPPSACTQALMLLYQLSVGSATSSSSSSSSNNKKNNKPSINKKKPGHLTDQQQGRQDRFYRALYASMSQQHPGLLSSGKHLTLYCNLLYKAMKHDTDSARVVAFAKQLLCTTLHSSPSMVAASLFLLSEVAKYHATTDSKSSVSSALQDCWEGAVMQAREAQALWDPTKREPRGALTWPEDDKLEKKNESSEAGGASANVGPTRAPLWELSLTAHHFHPSVGKFTTSLGDISYSGDPLKDFGLAPFLNKFAYRNPKSMEHIAKHFHRKESVAERKSGVVMEAYLAPPVNDPSFLQQQQVSEQDEFFQKFFAERARRDEIKGIVRKSSDGRERDEEEDEAFDTAEANEVDQDFGDLEDRWETDSEEEEFVDSLALSLMEDTMDEAADFDDEDPDMDDWDDMNDGKEVHTTDLPDDDVLLEEENNEDGEVDVEENDEMLEVEGQDSSDDDEEDLDAEEADFMIDSDDDDVDDESDGSDTDSLEKRPRKKRVVQPTFADASDYEEIIHKDWQRLVGNQKETKVKEEIRETKQQIRQKAQQRKKSN